MAEFSFGITWSLKYRCSFVGVTEEGAELVTWKLHSVWKQVKTPEDLAVLLKFSPFWSQTFPSYSLSPCGPKPHIARWNQNPLGLSALPLTLFMKQRSLKSTRAESISRVIRACGVPWIIWNSSCGEVQGVSDWLDKPHVLLEKERKKKRKEKDISWWVGGPDESRKEDTGKICNALNESFCPGVL